MSEILTTKSIRDELARRCGILKTRIAVRANGTVRLETIGRGKAVLRWLERMQGKKLLQLVGE